LGETPRQAVRGIAEDVLQGLRALGAVTGPQRHRGVFVVFDPEGVKRVLDRLAHEAGVEVLLHAFVTGATRRDDRVTEIVFHDHGAFKYFGKEKIANGLEGAAPGMAHYRSQFYGGAAIALELAKRGFVVLAHDAFAFGSRRFPLEDMPTEMQESATLLAERGDGKLPWEIRRYNAAAILHEHLIEKYCAILGGSFAALIAHDDRVALDCLLTLPEVDPARIGCLGLSGGGARAVFLRAVRDEVRATVVVGMMSTYERLLDRHVQAHSWLFFPRGGKPFGDWQNQANG